MQRNIKKSTPKKTGIAIVRWITKASSAICADVRRLEGKHRHRHLLQLWTQCRSSRATAASQWTRHRRRDATRLDGARDKDHVWRPHVRTWGLSEVNLLYWRKYLWHCLRLFGAPAVIWRSGICAPLAPPHTRPCTGSSAFETKTLVGHASALRFCLRTLRTQIGTSSNGLLHIVPRSSDVRSFKWIACNQIKALEQTYWRHSWTVNGSGQRCRMNNVIM